MPTILGANSVSGYTIENSLRFNDNDSAHLSRTVGTPTNQKIYTFSVWMKKGNLAHNTLIGTPSEGDTFDFGDRVQFHTNGSADSYLRTNRLFRDTSAWYHLVIAYNTEQSTAANRVKFYINGEQYTWDLSTTFPTEDNTNGQINKDGQNPLYIGRGHAGEYADGYMADFNLIDGQQLDPSYFGKTDNNGVWVPIKYTGTYGNNGFFLEFKQTGTSTNASGMGADTSGNGNHFAVHNLAATDVTTDTPTNNFATLNSVADISRSVTFTEGNTRASIGNGSTNRAHATMGFTSGKWYWEVKYISTSTGASHLEIGFTDPIIGLRYHIRGNDGERWDNGSSSSGTDHRHDPDDIIGVYVDADNQKWYLQVNGSNSNGGNGAADVSEGTGFIHQNFAVTDFLLPYFANASSGNGHVFEVNFGNAPFAISSSNSDANGHGSFEYNPTNDGVNFYALNSKNLAEFG